MKRNKNIILFIITIFIFCMNITKAEPISPIDIAEEECISKTGSTYEMNKCSQIAQQAWKKEIQNKLGVLKKILPEKDFAILLKSQQEWIHYVTAEYKFMQKIISQKEGTIYSNIEEGFKRDLLKQRAQILEEYIFILQE